MHKNEKTTQIAGIKEQFSKMSSAVFVTFQGMDVASVTKLRDEFRKNGVAYRVVKNTLVKQALKGEKYADTLGKNLTGMTGIAWSFEDPSAAAKVVTAFKKDNEKLKVKAGLIEGQVLDAKSVEESLAKMPGKNELRAMLLATLQAPMQQLLMLLNAPATNLVYALDAKKRKDGGELTPPPSHPKINQRFSQRPGDRKWPTSRKTSSSITSRRCPSWTSPPSSRPSRRSGASRLLPSPSRRPVVALLRLPRLLPRRRPSSTSSWRKLARTRSTSSRWSARSRASA